jgi:predicted outer membrane repeat protein
MVLQHGHAASGNGGALLAGSSTALTLNQVQVLSSTAPVGGGGGLYATFMAILTGTQFISNTSSLAGGGAVVGGAALLTNSRFERNTCTGSACQAGGLGVVGALTVTNTDFISNTSGGPGGGIYAESAVMLTKGSFQGNKCTDSGCEGGGLTALTTLTLADTQFISNTSIAAAGGAVVEGAAVLSNASFQGNQCTGSGCQAGGLGVAGRLTVTSTDFISNTSTSHGGGLYAGSSALLTGGRFERNTCTATGCQGGGLAAAAALTVTGTQFISNTSVLYGGGVAAAGAASVTNGRFENNQCTDNVNGCAGGGLAAGSGLTVTGTDFVSNTSLTGGGGLFAESALELIHDRFEDNTCTLSRCLGGGLYAILNTDVRGSSFSDNRSAGSGGALAISNTAQITLANVTLSGNRATISGGGLFAGSGGHASLFNVTMADNQAPSGGGLLVQPGATVGISNTIFSNNGANNCAGPIASGTHNLEWPAPAACATAGPSAGFTSANPYLAPLELNPPGATLTRALLIGSAARDQGDPATCANTPVNNVDQRGVARPLDGDLVPGAICDIGAFEAGRPFLFLPLVRR